MSGYMQGVTKKGIDLVSRITGLLNQLTDEDFEGTHVGLRVSIMEEDLSRELGFWSNEYGFGDWAFFDGARSDIEARKPKPLREALLEGKPEAGVTVEELQEAIASETPTNHTTDEGDVRRMALAVISLLKERGLA